MEVLHLRQRRAAISPNPYSKMSPVDFPESNIVFKGPEGLDETQVRPIRGYLGNVERGSMDGVKLAVVGWEPSEEDLVKMIEGGVIYLTVIGGLPPHYLSMDFHTATHPT